MPLLCKLLLSQSRLTRYGGTYCCIHVCYMFGFTTYLAVVASNMYLSASDRPMFGHRILGSRKRNKSSILHIHIFASGIFWYGNGFPDNWLLHIGNIQLAITCSMFRVSPQLDVCSASCLLSRYKCRGNGHVQAGSSYNLLSQ